MRETEFSTGTPRPRPLDKDAVKCRDAHTGHTPTCQRVGMLLDVTAITM
jgi:hypothetical protein